MDRQSFLDDLQARLALLMRSTPAADLEQNLKAVLGQAFQRMELVTREEFDLQRELLARTRARLEALEARLATLEGTGSESAPGTAPGTASGTAPGTASGSTSRTAPGLGSGPAPGATDQQAD